jgi:hypothetical protein
MNIPQITDIDTALSIYYRQSEIGNREIKTLFGKHSSATINKLKRLVKAEMIEKGIRSYTAHTVNTAIAFIVWGINIDDLEKRKAKLQKLGL